MTIKKQLITVKTDSVIPYENNPKVHWADQVELLAQSILDNWYNAPIIVDEDNVVLAWHGRLEAIKFLDWDDVEVLQITWLSDQQKKTYRLQDNKIAELSEWDFEALEYEIWEIGDMSISQLFDIEIEEWSITPLTKMDIDSDDFKLDVPSNKNKEIDPISLVGESKSNTLTCCPKCHFEFDTKYTS